MSHRCRTILLVCPFALLCILRCARAEEPTTRPAAGTGIVQGKVTSPGEVPLAAMVVYLESPAPRSDFVLPSEHVPVSQKGAKFSPAIVIVCVGQTVDFLNDEDRPIEHNVFSNSPIKPFDLGLYRPGESRQVLFDKPGAVFLYCSIHRHMDGVVFVSPSPFTSRVDPEGHYEIKGVPAGDWVVKTWQRRRRFPELNVPVSVQPDKSVTADLELHLK